MKYEDRSDKWVQLPILIPGTRVYKILVCWVHHSKKPTEKSHWDTYGYHVGEEAAWKAFEKESRCWHVYTLFLRFRSYLRGPKPHMIRRATEKAPLVLKERHFKYIPSEVPVKINY
jgi:hypothetical protein